MDADDFQELYKLLRGSRAATPVLDARGLFLDKRMADALDTLLEARELYAESRTGWLKQDPEKQVDPKAKDAEKQIKKLTRRRDKVVAILEAFDELIPALEKSAKREKDEAERASARMKEAEPLEEEQSDEIARPGDISSDLVESLAGTDGDGRLEMIDRNFGFQEVASSENIHANALYYIHNADRSQLVATPSLDESSETIGLVSVTDDQAPPSCSREDFLEMGKRREMVLLTRKTVP